MNGTKSFGLGYKLKENSKEQPQFDVHINFWDTDSAPPFIDFGIKIIDFRSVDTIAFTIPFLMNRNDLIDLSYVIKEDEIRLIFNDNSYSYVSQSKGYSSFIREENEKMTFLPIKKEMYGDYMDCVKEHNGIPNTYSIEIKLSSYSMIPADTNMIYYRFRINSENVEKALLYTLKEKNYYLESAFIERKIIDIKFNNERNLDRNFIDWYAKENLSLTKIKSIHLFIMVPSTYEVTIWDNFSECRKLENNAWNDYLQNKVDTNDIMAYHWKKKSKVDHDIDEFNQLVRIEHRATNCKILLMYCCIVILLGALGSGLWNFLELLGEKI